MTVLRGGTAHRLVYIDKDRGRRMQPVILHGVGNTLRDGRRSSESSTRDKFLPPLISEGAPRTPTTTTMPIEGQMVGEIGIGGRQERGDSKGV